MTTTVLPRPSESTPSPLHGARVSVALALAIWFLVVISLGAAGAFVAPPGAPPLFLGMGVGVPLVLFFAALRFSRSFRDFVLSLDLRLIAGVQAWRWAGLGFLFLYAYKILPAPFALTAGLGDMAIGLTAPWIALSLARRPDFAATSTFVRWNLLGILDLVVAVSIGTLSGLLASPDASGISTAPMQSLPLIVIPAFLVPVFLMLHTTALMQSRRIHRTPA